MRKVPALLLLLSLFAVSSSAIQNPFRNPFGQSWKWSATSVIFAPHKSGQPYPPMAIRLTNTGSKSLPVRLVSCDHPFGAEIAGSAGFVLAAKQSVDVMIYFSPLGPDSYHGFLNVEINGKAQRIALSGEGN